MDMFMCSGAFSNASNNPTEPWTDWNIGKLRTLQQDSYNLLAITLPLFTTGTSDFYTDKDAFLFVSGT